MEFENLENMCSTGVDILGSYEPYSAVHLQVIVGAVEKALFVLVLRTLFRNPVLAHVVSHL